MGRTHHAPSSLCQASLGAHNVPSNRLFSPILAGPAHCKPMAELHQDFSPWRLRRVRRQNCRRRQASAAPTTRANRVQDRHVPGGHGHQSIPNKSDLRVSKIHHAAFGNLRRALCPLELLCKEAIMPQSACVVPAHELALRLDAAMRSRASLNIIFSPSGFQPLN